jgi:hypothetical protein
MKKGGQLYYCHFSVNQMLDSHSGVCGSILGDFIYVSCCKKGLWSNFFHYSPWYFP